ncbi:MAG: HEAT repeat domain-containing protein, partial [Limisphaerales bacterium]
HRTGHGGLAPTAIHVATLRVSGRLALAVLLDAVRSDPLSGFRVFAIVTLGEAGPAARSAIPALKQALSDRDAEVRDAAARALKRIETEPVAK